MQRPEDMEREDADLAEIRSSVRASRSMRGPRVSAAAAAASEADPRGKTAPAPPPPTSSSKVQVERREQEFQNFIGKHSMQQKYYSVRD